MTNRNNRPACDIMAKQSNRALAHRWGHSARRQRNRKLGCCKEPRSTTLGGPCCGPATKRTAVVVLGQRLNPDGSAPAILASRMEACARLADGDAACIILTGGDASRVGKSEARAMKDLYLAIRLGGTPGPGPEPEMVPEVILEENSLTTVWNAMFCLPLLRYKNIDRVILVTSDFHMPRSAMIFEAICPQIAICRHSVPIPVPYSYDAGINALPPLQRMKKEYEICSDLPRLSRHINNQARYVGLLPDQRTQQCKSELEEIMNKIDKPPAGLVHISDADKVIPDKAGPPIH